MRDSADAGRATISTLSKMFVVLQDSFSELVSKRDVEIIELKRAKEELAQMSHDCKLLRESF